MAKINDGTVLFHKSPASFMGNRWLDASVTGSGNVTAAILGAYARESILINHVDLKWRGYTGVLQDVSDVFPKIKKHYNEAKIFDAEKTLSGELEKRGYKPAPAQHLPLVMLNVNFINENIITDYSRTTDMKSGEVCIEYKTNSATIQRGLFVHRGSDVIAYNVTKSGTHKFDAVLSLEPIEETRTPNTIVKYEGGMMYYSNRGANGLDYGFVARIINASGNAEITPGGVMIKGTDGFTVFAKTFVNSSTETEFKNIKNELSTIKVTYDKMQAQSENAHRKIFDALTLKLGSVSNGTCELSHLIGATELTTGLVERLFNFGKYLLVIGYDKLIQPNVVVTNHLLYDGIAKSIEPNKILQLLEFYEKYVDDLKKNSARIFGYRGYFIPSVVSPESALLGSTDAGVIHFIASGAVTANLLYSYYLATMDVKILKNRIYPFMKEIFNFYSDFLKLDSNGLYTTMPSYSPNSTPGNIIQGKPLVNFKFATNSTIDFLALENLLDNLCEAGVAIGSTDEIPMWQDMKTKIPQYSVADNGGIKEYTNSAFISGAYNCGCMHSYGLWPLKNFSFSDESVEYRPAVSGTAPVFITLKAASANAIYNRLATASGLQTSAILSMYAVQLAHASESAAVRNMLLRLVASSFAPSGLCLSNDWRGSGWTGTGPVDLDVSGNIGFATAITECIIQSNSREMKILPSIFDEIENGRIEGVVTDFGARVNLEWDANKGRAMLKILPKANCTIDIIVPKGFKPRTKGIEYEGSTGTIKNVKLVADKALTIEF